VPRRDYGRAREIESHDFRAALREHEAVFAEMALQMQDAQTGD
jgi:hypothetical protein